MSACSPWMVVTHAEAETEALAMALAPFLTAGTAILLSGDLGAGKSVFARGVLRGLGVEDDYILSPTFALVNVYTETRLPVAHFDLYRLASSDDVEMLGLEEYVDGLGVVIVEWAERCGDCFFGEPFKITLLDVPDEPDARQIVLQPLGLLSQEIVNAYQRSDFFGR